MARMDTTNKTSVEALLTRTSTQGSKSFSDIETYLALH